MFSNFISLEGAPLREITPAERSRVACCPVGIMVSSISRFKADVSWFLFTVGMNFFRNSVTQANCSPLNALRMDTDCPSLHSTLWRVDLKP